MVVGSQIAIANILADLYLAVAQAVCQSVKFNSPPNFWLYGIVYYLEFKEVQGLNSLAGLFPTIIQCIMLFNTSH